MGNDGSQQVYGVSEAAPKPGVHYPNSMQIK